MSETRLILGDCLTVLADLEAGSVDAVVCDPPYGQTNESYDGPIAFSPNVWRECFRVAKPNAALLSFAGNPTYHRIASAIEAGGWKVRQMWAWVYRDGLITSAWPREGFDRLAPAMDPIVYATKGKVLLRLKREGEPWAIRAERSKASPLSERFRSPATKQANGHYHRTLVSDGAEPFRYFALARAGGGKTEKHGHPNQKPLALMRWLLDKLPPGGTVLDPFAGSGTTGVACLQTGRNFVGCEISSEYHAIAEKRIAAARRECDPLFSG